MKKKMFVGIAALLFIAVTAINVNLARQSQNSNALLEKVAVMAQAQSEGSGQKYYRGTCNCYRGGVPKIENFAGCRYICFTSPIGDDSCTETSCSPGSSCS